MLKSITRLYLLILGILFVSGITYAQAVVCYMTGSLDDNNVYGSGCASIPYGSTAHISNLKMTMTSPYGRSSQTWSGNHSMSSGLSLFDAAGVEEDGDYSLYLTIEGECYWNSSTHVMAAAYTTVFDKPRITVSDITATKDMIKLGENSELKTIISCSKSIAGRIINFHAIRTGWTCGTVPGGTPTCPPGTLNPTYGTLVPVTLSVNGIQKTWTLSNDNSEFGKNATVTVSIGTDDPAQLLWNVKNNWVSKTITFD